MADVTVLGAAWFVLTVFVAAVMWAAQIGPRAAVSNLSDWATWFGLTPPQWLRSPEADRVVKRGGPAALAALAVAGAWIFLSIEAAVYTGCAELIGFALFALRRRSRSLGIALTIISFVSLGIGIWIVISNKPDGAARDTATAAPASTTAVQPGTGNPLSDSINTLLAKREKKVLANSYALVGRSPNNFGMADAADGRGGFIEHWGSDLGPWPRTSEGFTEDQLRKEPSRLIDHPFEWSTQGGLYNEPDGSAKISVITMVARNDSSEEVVLNDAYLISGNTGEKRGMKIQVGSDFIPIPEIGAIPPGAAVVLKAEMAPAGLNEVDFLKDWSIIYFVYQINGKKPARSTLDQKIFKQWFDGSRPKVNTEPRVTRKK